MSRLVMIAALVGLAVAGCAGTDATGGHPVPAPPDSSTAPPPDSVEEVPAMFPDAVDRPGNMTVRTFDSAEVGLRGPHFSLGLSWVATGGSIDERSSFDAIGLKPRRAGNDHEILVLAVDPEFIAVQWRLADRPKPVAELVVGGKPRPLSRVPIPNPDGSAPDGPGVVVATSVPKNAPVLLTVRDMGRVQTLDVRTGKRGDDAIAGYYRPTSQTLSFDRELPTGVVARGASYPITLAVADTELGAVGEPYALLAAWKPAQEWAAPGRAWLILPGPVLSTDVRAKAPGLILAIDESAAFRVRLPDGTQVPELGGSQEVYTLLGGQASDLVFDVPADFAGGTYLINLSTAGVTAQFSDGDVPARWKPAPPVIEVHLNLTTR